MNNKSIKMLNQRQELNSWLSPRCSLSALMCLMLSCQLIHHQVATQGLPEDIQRELNQNLAEQARIQAQRARHQQQIQSRAAAGGPAAGGLNNQHQQARPAHDPNNYSYQQVSPPIQYSYYQPFGDAAPQQQQPASSSAPQQQQHQHQHQQQQQQQPVQPINIDLNNLNFDLPTPQAQVSSSPPVAQQRQQHLTPSFTGAGGLPVMQPVAATANQAPPVDSFAPLGQAPLAPQARVQQGPPLTEADFKDITGGENYGAPGGSDFGMSAAGGGGGQQQQQAEPRSVDNTDAQLREFGMPDEQQQAPQAGRRQSNPLAEFGAPTGMGGGGAAGGIPDFGGFNPLGGGGGGGGGGGSSARRSGLDSDPFAGFGGSGMGGGGRQGGGSMPGGQAGNEFDFASQPSSARGDQAQAAMQGGAPGSLQNLLGNAFPGLGGGSGANMGLDGLARGSGAGGAPEAQLPDFGADGQQQQQQQQNGRGRSDDGAMDVADLGDRADGFSGADLGGFEQPTPSNDQDYNYAAAAEQQPTSVPYPDGAPQPVGTLWALTQPQSLSQARYNALPDKGTYQSYPAYQSGGNDFGAVRDVVDETPGARPPGQGRYGHPAASQLAPEHQPAAGGAPFDYGQSPSKSAARNEADDDVESSFISDAFD